MPSGPFDVPKSPTRFPKSTEGTTSNAEDASRTELESYLPAFFVAGAFCLLAAILAITLNKPGITLRTATAAH